MTLPEFVASLSEKARETGQLQTGRWGNWTITIGASRVRGIRKRDAS